ncbi:DUF4190 domain-containing protein [Actinocatenispora thailandica]|uniref:DUF4190 domain-containing protein n=1 Tax=Actinocatenispora thailandica TaxID=227318 RepID=UPI0031D12606
MSWPTPPGEPPGGPYYDEQPYSPYALPAGSDSPPYGPPPPYGQPQYGQAPPYGPPPSYGYPVQQQRTNAMAIASLVCSLCGIFVVPLAASIAGIIFGHVAKKQLKTSGEEGDGLATAGLIVGYIFGGLYLLGCLGYIGFVVLAIGAVGASGGYDSGSGDYSFVLPVLTGLFGG